MVASSGYSVTDYVKKQAMLVRQLEEELRLRMRNPSIEMQAQMDALFAENEHLTREVAILRETIRELELRIETQKQTLQARDESIKKLLEMLQTKGIGGNKLEESDLESLQAKIAETDNIIRHFETIVRNRDQELNKIKRELKAKNESLRALQIQLENALRNPNTTGNSTLTAILETKDARIANLEKEVQLLEQELERIRDISASSGFRDNFRISSPLLDFEFGSKNEYFFKKQLDDFRAEIQRRDQEILAMSAKMKTLEEQHQDYQRHIAVLKESLCAKEEHYNMMQADVEELRNRLDEKNRAIEKKTQQANQATAEKNRLTTELNEIRDHMDIKDRKINVLQRKMELFEANKKLQAAGNQRGPPPGAEQEMNNLRRQLDEARRQMDQQKSQFEEYRKQVDNRARQLDERDKSLANVDQQLKKRKEQLDQLESQLRKGPAPSQGGVDPAEVDKLVNDLAQAQENAKRSQEEMDRLLKLVQMSQEEQNAKEKQIHDLQTALKNAQAKIKQQQQQQQAQQDEQCETDGGKPTLETVELLKELSMKESRITYLENDVAELEQALTERGSMAELEELVDVVKLKNDRIEELEEALRESVRITADRENILQEEQRNRKHIIEKVGKLEQRLLSLQNAHALRCSICRPLVTRFKKMEKRLVQVLSERRKQLQDLARMKREALEAAISEKDAHLGLLELSGIRTARQADEYEQLRSDRKRLMERLKEENERSIELIHEFSEDFDFLTPPIVDFDDEEEDNDERDHSNSTDASRSSENSTSDDGEGL